MNTGIQPPTAHPYLPGGWIAAGRMDRVLPDVNPAAVVVARMNAKIDTSLIDNFNGGPSSAEGYIRPFQDPTV